MMPNVALFLEPFPLRNSLASHAWIGERLCGMLLNEAGDGFALSDFRVICNQPTMTHLVGLSPAARPYFLELDGQCQEAFSAMLADWHSSALETWEAIQKGSDAHVDIYEACLVAARNIYPFEVVVYWGTNETLRAAASRVGVDVLWAELGPLRPPFTKHYCLDPKGVNGTASSRAELPSMLDDAHGGMTATALDLKVGHVTAYEASMSLPAPGALLDVEPLLAFVRGSSRVVLLATQLADDANVLAFAFGITCEEMVRSALAELTAPRTVFILRPHPAAGASYHNYAADAVVRSLVKGRADVMVFDAPGEQAYLACLSIVTEVVCLNSSVAFEAALLGKSVRVLGEASYTPLGHRPGIRDPALRLPEETLTALLDRHYVPELRFWTLAHWREAATALRPQPPVGTPEVIRLPIAAARTMGAIRSVSQGMVVAGLGTLLPSPAPIAGALDAVLRLPNGTIKVSGWGADPASGGALAGFIITTGSHSVWSAVPSRRPDVAAYFRDPGKVNTGFEMIIAAMDLPDADVLGVQVFGVTTSGFCQHVGERWLWSPQSLNFHSVAPSPPPFARAAACKPLAMVM